MEDSTPPGITANAPSSGTGSNGSMVIRKRAAVGEHRRKQMSTQRTILVAAALYLTVPVWVFFALTFQPVAALVLTALCVLATSPLLRTVGAAASSVRLGKRSLMVLAAISLVLVVVGGAGHLVYANSDWLKHDAVLQALSENPWPVTYAHRDGGDVILRYYAAFYTVPAAVARVIGHADILLMVWEWMGLFLSLSGLALLLKTSRQRVIGLGYFLAFSGLDFVGWLLLKGNMPSASKHLEQWTIMSYNSTVTLIAWVPQHAFAAWLAMLLIKDTADNRKFLAALPMLMAAVTFWSLFVAVGLAPLLAVPVIRSIRRHGIKQLFGPASIAGMLVAGALVAFLLSGSGNNTRHGWIWDLYPSAPVLKYYVAFIALEVLVLGAVLLIAGVRFGLTAWIAVGVLLVLPLYVVGGASSDLTMRSSLPAQFVLVLAFLRWLSTGARRTGGKPRGFVRWAVLIPLILTTAIGLRTATPEVVRAFSTEPLPTFPFRSQLLALIAWPLDVPDSQYVAHESPWMSKFLRHNETTLPMTPVDFGSSPRFASSSPGTQVVDDMSSVTFTVGPNDAGTHVMQSKSDIGAGVYRVHFVMQVDRSHSPGVAFVTVADTKPVRLPPTGDPGTFEADDFIVIETPGRVELHLQGVSDAGATVSLRAFSVERVDSPLTGSVSTMLERFR